MTRCRRTGEESVRHALIRHSFDIPHSTFGISGTDALADGFRIAFRPDDSYNASLPSVKWKERVMGQRRDRLDNRIAKQKSTRRKNAARKAKERERKAARVEAQAARLAG
jgi:hypothetical protein